MQNPNYGPFTRAANIPTMVSVLRNVGFTDETIRRGLMEQFSLSVDEAAACVRLSKQPIQ